MQGIIKTIIVADRILLREGLISLLNQTPYKIISCVGAVGDIRDLKLSPKRRILTIIGVSREMGKTIQMVRDVRQIVRGGRIVAIGECVEDLAGRDILDQPLDGILINVNSREVLLKALDLTFLAQQIVIIGKSEYREQPYSSGPQAGYGNGIAAVGKTTTPCAEMVTKSNYQ